ncbi:hypothetical protein [Hymenobacter elongatus]|nr:hypothetical protein [Hymenobacter elongatus]
MTYSSLWGVLGTGLAFWALFFVGLAVVVMAALVVILFRHAEMV